MARVVAVESLRSELDGAAPETLLKWAISEFGDGLALACSFGAEDVVLVDMLARLTARPRIFAIDTGRLHEATYEVMERVRERYAVSIETYCPDREAVEQLERQHGFFSFKRSLDDRHACCQVRKVEPLGRALAHLDAWITGLRREQSVTRTQVSAIEHDAAHRGIAKLNPLVDWTNDDVWGYIREHNVPYNRLHDDGFPSIGCEPCTRAVKPGEHPRAGRWWWESPEHRECGLHVPSTQQERAATVAGR